MSTAQWAVPFAFVLAACGNEFRSINPIALPTEHPDVPDLVGDWVDVRQDDSSDLIRIVSPRDQTGSFLIAAMDSSTEVTRYHALATSVGGRLLLDVWQEPANTHSDLQLPLHMPVYVAMSSPDTLVLRFLDGDSLEAYLAREPGSLAHTEARPSAQSDETMLIVTAETADIRRFLASYQERTAVFGEPSTLRRAR